MSITKGAVMVPENASVNLNSTTKASAARASLRARNSEKAPIAAWSTRVKALSALVAASARADCPGSVAAGAGAGPASHHPAPPPNPGRRSRDAGALESADDEQRPRRRDQHADPVGRDIGRHAGGLLAFGQALDAKRIDPNVLGRGHHRHPQPPQR